MAALKPLAFCEVHKPGLCDVAWLPIAGGGAALLTAGHDGRLCYRSSEAPGEAAKEVQNANNGVSTPIHCIAAAQGRPVVTGDDQNFVKLYSHPAGEPEGVATRFTLPVRALALSPSGLNLAAGGDDEGIKLVDLATCKVFRQIKSQAYTRSLAYDPEGAHLAAVAADGSLSIWDIQTGKQQLLRRKACPKLDPSSRGRSQAAWHPDGGALLAAPGLENDVVFYERMSWEAAFSLAGQHSAPVSLLAFSRNGLYLVSAAADKSLVLWDVNERKCLQKRTLPGAATGVAWHPTSNELAIVTEDGQLAIWDGVVPPKLPGPAVDVDALNGIKKGGQEGAAAAAGAAADGVSVLEGGGGGGGGGGTAVGASDDYDRDDSFLADSGPKPGPRRGRRGAFAGFSSFDLPQPQDPIQPGATEMGDSGRCYLAYTPLGCITLKQEEDHNVVEVTFHDTSRQRKRVPLLNDFFGFTLGSLGDKGALYASRSNSESASTIVYRPFEAWAPNSDWSLALPKGEEAECAAAGSSFCAVATSRRHLRLFSPAGSQTHLLTLPGAPVALAASGHALVAAWHAGPPASSGDQCLRYALYDVAEQRQLHAGPLPLSPGATLAWLGFTEEGQLASYDSHGELRLRSADFGGTWVTAFSATAERKSTEQYWVVGLSARELRCIVCANSHEPAVPSGMQRPVVTAVPLRPPVVAADAAISPFEADLIRHGALLSHLGAAATEAKDADEAERLEAAVQAAQLEADRMSLRLIQKLLAADRQARALEAACCLHNMPALEGALKLAKHHRATALAERISAAIEQRMALEAAALEQAEAEQYQQYHDDVAPRQHGAITPVPGPTFTDHPAASPVAAATAGDMSRAASPPPRRTSAGGGGGGNPFARQTVEHPENSPGNASAAAVAAKRKAPMGGNPFARKTKAAKA